jgi:hypothetical protein
MTFDENSPWMTVFACVLAVLYTIVGGVVALVHTETLSFSDYLDKTGKVAVAVAALGVGRSLKKGLTRGAGVEVGGGWLNRAPVTTFTVGAMVLVAGLTGGVLTIADPALLSFDQYLDQMTTFAAAVGIQGAARAVRQGIEAKGAAEGAGGAPAAGAAAAGAAGPGAAGPGAGAGPDVGGLSQHPDFAGAAGLAPIVPSTGPEPDFVDPEDVASVDDDLGAAEEPAPASTVATVSDTGYADISGEDLDESDLPTDEEEEAHPPPDDLDLLPADAYALDAPGAGGPSAVMPSQEDGRPR